MVALGRPAGQRSIEPLTQSARAPGRVNLMGDHTDYNGGVALPMAIDLYTEVTFTRNDSGRILLFSAIDPRPASFPIDVSLDPRSLIDISPPWARLAAAMAALVRPASGGVGRISSTVPTGAGLSSSAALAVALALVFGAEGSPLTFAQLCQRSEAAAGSSVGLMDPLVSAGGRAGHALLIDFSKMTVDPVALPAGAEIVVVHSGQPRALGHTPYAARRAECEAAALELGGPLGLAEAADITGLLDPVLRRRTRHVVTECARVREFAGALRHDDLAGAGRLMVESHRSLAADFEVSTPALDELVDNLVHTPGVFGARLTGGGFGGCVVALTAPGALDVAAHPGRAWRVQASGGASLRTLSDPGAA
jgi:galactokinase